MLPLLRNLQRKPNLLQFKLQLPKLQRLKRLTKNSQLQRLMKGQGLAQPRPTGPSHVGTGMEPPSAVPKGSAVSSSTMGFLCQKDDASHVVAQHTHMRSVLVQVAKRIPMRKQCMTLTGSVKRTHRPKEDASLSLPNNSARTGVRKDTNTADERSHFLLLIF